MPNLSASHEYDTASAERRGERRIAATGVCDVIVINDPSSEKLTGTVIDVSRSGLQLELAKLIEPGSIIQVHMRNLMVFGAVGSCRQSESGRFRLGVATGQMIESA